VGSTHKSSTTERTQTPSVQPVDSFAGSGELNIPNQWGVEIYRGLMIAAGTVAQQQNCNYEQLFLFNTICNFIGPRLRLVQQQQQQQTVGDLPPPQQQQVRTHAA
jgi:hypothetical protein